ncbi:MAG: sigma-70 family RNA polymerase sigma factor [Planctomycetes bacterium]|nr:sigma-70 family RNA polymerase sigma factor [Planctomycetota bacterium]
MSDSVLPPGKPADGAEVPDGEVDDRVQSVLAGDQTVFAALYAEYRPRLLRMVAFRLDPRLRGRIDPEDVVQDAYVDAARRLDAFRTSQPMSMFVWLRLILGQTLIDLHRHHLGVQKRDAHRDQSIQARLSGDTSMSMSFHLMGHLSTPSQLAVRAELSQLVSRALEEMNPIDREVLALRHFEELTNKEVSEVLGLDRKAASIRYVRALARLKEVLQSVPGFFDNASRG